MPKKKETVTITITLDENVKNLLEKSATEMDLTLSRYARNIIYTTIDDLPILQNLKLINLDIFKIYLKPKNIDLKGLKLKESPEQVNISVVLRKDVKDKLSRIADSLGLTTKQVTRNLIYVGLHEHDFLKKLGLIQTISIAKGFIGSVYEVFGNSKKKGKAT